MKNCINKISIFIMCLFASLTLIACNDTNDTQTPEPETPVKTPTPEQNPDYNFPYDDMIERPSDIPPLADLEYVSYPEKPTNMSAGQGSGMPLVGTPTTNSEYYKITEEEGKITVKFYEVGRWDYVFIPISNFNSEYQNIKITATATNIQKLAISAVYYEMYDEGHPAVTTLLHDVGDSEQYYIMELGKTKLLDESYYPLEETLGTQTVFGLCLFIDSNPSQTISNKKTDIQSVFEISSIEFLKDGDPSIGDRYVEPSLSVGWVDDGYLAEKDAETKEFTVEKVAGAAVWTSAALSVSNYSSEYAAFTMSFTTTNVKTITIEAQISGGLAGWADAVTIYKETNLTDGTYTKYIDFSSVQPTSTSTWAPVPGYYIKNYKISNFKIYLDTADATELNDEAATLVIHEVKFERLAQDSNTISKGWAGSPYVQLGDDLVAGGVGSVEVTWHNSWEYLTMPVLNYETSEKLVVKFEAPDGLDYMGIALGGAQYAMGEAVLKSCWNKVGFEEEKTGIFEGITEKVEYDAATKIYTITFNFKNATQVESLGGKRLNEVLITSLRFYFTDPNSTAPYEGTRTVRFISVEFK